LQNRVSLRIKDYFRERKFGFSGKLPGFALFGTSLFYEEYKITKAANSRAAFVITISRIINPENQTSKRCQ
jgi:hypothetical protein